MYQDNGSSSNNNYNIVYGNSLDLTFGECESEIRADVTVEELQSVRLWGRIINCNGDSIPSALLKLVKVVTDCCGKVDYHGVAHTVSDCNGFYQFDLCTCPEDTCFKIIVSKASYGPERIIKNEGGNCNPCDDADGYPFNPCVDYGSFKTPQESCTCAPQKPACDCGCKKPAKYM